MTDNLPWGLGPDGLRLAVRLTPRAGRSEITGIVAAADGRPALAIRIAAPPVDGAANRALIAFLADALALPKSAVSLRSGETARLKIVDLQGDPAVVHDRLERLAGIFRDDARR